MPYAYADELLPPFTYINISTSSVWENEQDKQWNIYIRNAGLFHMPFHVTYMYCIIYSFGEIHLTIISLLVEGYHCPTNRSNKCTHNHNALLLKIHNNICVYGPFTVHSAFWMRTHVFVYVYYSGVLLSNADWVYEVGLWQDRRITRHTKRAKDEKIKAWLLDTRLLVIQRYGFFPRSTTSTMLSILIHSTYVCTLYIYMDYCVLLFVCLLVSLVPSGVYEFIIELCLHKSTRLMQRWCFGWRVWKTKPWQYYYSIQIFILANINASKQYLILCGKGQFNFFFCDTWWILHLFVT